MAAAALESLQSGISDLRAATQSQQKAIDGVFFMGCSIFIFMMQLGFALLEAGTVRSKNVKTALLKNVLDLSIAAILWYLIGHSLSGASGDWRDGAASLSESQANASSSSSSLTRTPLFINVYGNYSPESKDISQFVLLYGFLATADTIVSGAVLARMNIYAYLCSTILMTVWIYPLASFWIWSQSGWLLQLGAIDNAGGAVVHIIGGSAALAACYIAGPRHGRFMRVSGKWIDMGIEPHNVVLQTMGCLLLYIGWLAFNSSSLYSDGSIELVQVAMRNTLLGGSGGFVTVFVYKHMGKKPIYPKQRKFLVPALTGSLAGLAGVTSNCGITTGWAALLTGSMCSLASIKASNLLAKWRIDDPVDAVGVHLVAGSIGTIMTGLFANPELSSTLRSEKWLPGLFYPPYSFHLLGCQLLTVVVYICWSGIQTYAFLYLLKKYVFKASFTYSTKAQIRGLDFALCGGVAYPDFTFINISSSLGSVDGSRGPKTKGNIKLKPEADERKDDSESVSIVSDDGAGGHSLRRRQVVESQQMMNVQVSTELEENAESSQSGPVDVAIEMPRKESNSDGSEEPGVSNSSGDTEAGEGNGVSDALDKLNTREATKNITNELTQQLRTIDDCSEEDQYRASPGNRLDEILDGDEDRCAVIMTGLGDKYTLAMIRNEVDRDFRGDYSLIGLATAANMIVVVLRTPLVVMRFAAQFKIEKWSQAIPGSTVTDSGTVVELEAPNVEYCRIQDEDTLAKLFTKHGLPFYKVSS
eukprot:g4426.t1